ncbi:MAG: hypothetical protein ACTSR8_19370 [Promethearchaeota archaeon]
MNVKTSQIRIIGDEIIQLEIGIPKSETKDSSVPSEIAELKEMGWNILKSRNKLNNYDIFQVEFKSYPLQHVVKVECEQSVDCPFTSHGNPKDSLVSGRIIIPATVIGSEEVFIWCSVTDDQINCKYPSKENQKPYQESLTDEYNEVTILDDMEFDGTIYFKQNLDLENEKIKKYHVQIDYFPPDTEEFKLEPWTHLRDRKDDILNALENPRKVMSKLIWNEVKECIPHLLKEDNNMNLRKASLQFWSAVNLATDALLAHQTNTKKVFNNRVEKLNEVINEVEADTPLWYNLGKYKEIYQEDKEILYEQCFLNGVCNYEEIDTQVRKTAELMVFTEWFVNRGEKN